MKRILKTLYKQCSFITRPLYGGIGHILMFHRVCPSDQLTRLGANAGMEVTPTRLETIIQFFRDRHYEFISLTQLEARLKSKTNKTKFVIFTFDDGYADNYYHAYPIFKKYNVPFAIYITTSFPDREAILWWYLLEDLLIERDTIVVKTGTLEQEFNCRDLAEKEKTFLDIRSIIMNSKTFTDYTRTIKDIFESYGMDLYQKTSELTLSWEQIGRLNQDPLVTIGAHTLNHFVLSKLSTKEAINEIQGSKNRIESHLNREVNHFAYPFGGSDEAGHREFNLIKEIGFETAVTTRFASIFPRHIHYLECLPRIFVHHEADDGFLKQVVNGILSGMVNKFRRVVTV